MSDREAIIDMVSASARILDLDAKSLADAIVSSLDCVAVCTICADACAAEPTAAELGRCVRLNLDCVDLCEAVARMLCRVGDPHSSGLRAALEACIDMCVACAAECRKHGERHAYCAVCAEVCQTCARACQGVLEVLVEGPSA